MSGPGMRPEMGTDIVGLDARAVRASVQIVSQASSADLARPTPCSARWTRSSRCWAGGPTGRGYLCRSRPASDHCGSRYR
jgi:hypothetical protein